MKSDFPKNPTMKTAAIVLLTVASHALVALASSKGSAQRLDKTPGVVEVETIIRRGQKIDSLDDLVAALGLDCGWSLEVEASKAISPELTRQRLRVYYEGIKVRTFTLQASVDEDNYYTGAVSGYLPDLSSVNPGDGVGVKRRDVKDALATYASGFSKGNQPQVTAAMLDHFRFERQIAVDLVTGEANVGIYAEARVNLPDLIRNPRALFDTSLNVVKGRVYVRNAAAGYPASNSCPNAQGGNERFPGLTYGAGPSGVCLATEVRGEHCCLKSDAVIVKDCNNQVDRSQAKVVRFVCADGLNDNFEGSFSPNADVFYYSNVFADVLDSWGNTELSKTPITMYTHYGNVPNSFWDGESATFGGGDGVRVYSFVDREVVGHELGHALVETSKNMGFNGEYLAVEESFADICGKAITAYLYEAGQVSVFNWKFAETLAREGADLPDALRYMNDPTRDGHSVDNVLDFAKVNEDHPALGSGIFNEAFYLAVTAGVSYQDAFEVFVFANSVYWHEDTGFFDGACGVLRAASDIGANTDVFKKAFLEVGIDLCFCSLSGTA